jgi:hypothetical protein
MDPKKRYSSGSAEAFSYLSTFLLGMLIGCVTLRLHRQLEKPSLTGTSPSPAHSALPGLDSPKQKPILRQWKRHILLAGSIGYLIIASLHIWHYDVNSSAFWQLLLIALVFGSVNLTGRYLLTRLRSARRLHRISLSLIVHILNIAGLVVFLFLFDAAPRETGSFWLSAFWVLFSVHQASILQGYSLAAGQSAAEVK